MIDSTAISEVEWHPSEWKYQKMVLSLKHYDGKIWLDARKWLPKGKPEDGEMRKSKGLMMELRHWRGLLPSLIKTLDDNKDL